MKLNKPLLLSAGHAGELILTHEQAHKIIGLLECIIQKDSTITGGRNEKFNEHSYRTFKMLISFLEQVRKQPIRRCCNQKYRDKLTAYKMMLAKRHKTAEATDKWLERINVVVV